MNSPEPIKEIILDTETTGLDLKFDRIIELAAIEVVNGKRTSRIYHSYFNPYPIKVSKSAFAIHGISDEFLGDKPTFKQEAKTFLSFIKGHTLIAHNAKFDAMMLNSELERIGYRKIDECQWYDSLKLAKQLFPGKANSLAALCKRYKLKVDTSVHSAIRDCELLLQIYELMSDEKVRNMLALSTFK
ncbi:MAG: exonuclease domain-containing protein [Candidatus Hodgkinia cicadicola]